MTDETAQTAATEPAVDYAAEIERYKAKAANAEREAIELRKGIKKLGVPTDKLPDILSEYETLKAEREAREAEIARKAGDFEKLVAQKDKHWQGEIEKLNAELAAVRASEHQAVVKSGLQSALAESGATNEGLELLPDILHNRVKIETTDGKRVVRVYEADGETPMLNKRGEPAALTDLTASLVDKYPSLFKAAGKAGSGTQPGQGGGAAKIMNRATFDALGADGKMQAIRDGVKITD